MASEALKIIKRAKSALKKLEAIDDEIYYEGKVLLDEDDINCLITYVNELQHYVKRTEDWVKRNSK